MKPARRTILIVLAVAFLLLVVGGRSAAEFVTDLLWYRSVALDEVFWTRWRAAVAVRGTTGLVIAAIVFANLWVVTRALGTIRVRRRYANIEIAERLPQVYVVAALSAVSLFSGWWLSAGVANPLPVLAALRPESWGFVDPIFGLDASFYVFQLPILNRLQTLGALLVFWIALLVTAAYVATGAVKVTDGKPTVSPLARRHLGMLLAAFLLLYAANVWLERYGLVVSGSGISGAFGYTDFHARLPAKLVVFAVAVIAAGAVGFGTWVGNLRLPVLGAVLFIVGLVGAEGIYPASVQRFVVEPNEFPREATYIDHHLDYARRAYGLHDLTRAPMEYDARAELDEALLVDRLGGIPLWDPRPLMTTYQQRQGLFRYYQFASVHHDRYGEGDRREAVAISVRELETNELEPQAQTWQNLRLNYVSGEGAVASPVARMAADGTPVFYLSDLDPPRLAPDAPQQLRLEQPSVYFGERTRGYVILGPQHPPLGVALDATWKKVLYAWAFQSANIFLSGDLGSDSRIVYRRTPVERVQAAAPFVHVSRDRGPQPVIHEGRVIWIVDAYTLSPSFPLSPAAAFDGRLVRYVRNSVKATVDGLTGEVTLFATGPDDPILRTYQRIFPGLVRPLDQMPAGLQEHLRYPVQLMQIQAQVLGSYHLLDPRAFYAQQDVWSTATEQYRGTPQMMEPAYSMFPLPGSDDREFLLSVPFVPRGRQNLTALFITRNDPGRYGEQILFLMPRDELVPGPQQIEAMIDQDPIISQQLALWRRGGADVLRGHINIVPIGGSLVYVEPLFLEAENAAIPQLERVILARADRVVMEPSFGSAVAALLGDRGEAEQRRNGVAEAPAFAELGITDPATLTRARQLYEQAEAQLRVGDWAGFGRSWEALREVLSTPMGGGF
jgi:uncharacterized protein